MGAIELDRLTKVYADGTRAVNELDLEVADGEFVVFVGPSGCGKTSALRMIAGLEDITSGEVRVAGKLVNGLPPRARDMAMIFQNYALYPHMNVFENMAFGLKMRGIDKGEIKRRVEAAAKVLGLSDVLSKRPRHLSGGQRQRVAMGRAIVREPVAVSAIGAAHGRRMKKRRTQRPRKLCTSACASSPATRMTTACEMTVKRNVCHRASRKIGFSHSRRKLVRPIHLPVSEPPVASVKLR